MTKWLLLCIHIIELTCHKITATQRTSLMYTRILVFDMGSMAGYLQRVRFGQFRNTPPVTFSLIILASSI
uniref:Putative secreted protein n=1 Tax=Rhipicephalus microplus TaxID=6941 RepID=A0A6G5A2P3_RHIMP